MDLMAAITGIPGIGPALPYIAAAVAIAAGLAPFLPAPKQPSGAYATLYGVVNFVALNMGHARNAGAPTGTPVGPAVVALLAVGLSLTACGQTATQQAAGIRSGVEAAGCLLDAAGHVVAVVQVPTGTAQKALVAAGAAGAVLSTDPMCPAALNDGLAAAPRQ